MAVGGHSHEQQNQNLDLARRWKLVGIPRRSGGGYVHSTDDPVNPHTFPMVCLWALIGAAGLGALLPLLTGGFSRCLEGGIPHGSVRSSLSSQWQCACGILFAVGALLTIFSLCLPALDSASLKTWEIYLGVVVVAVVCGGLWAYCMSFPCASQQFSSPRHARDWDSLRGSCF